jgi:pilus assembly protein CpaC
MARYSAGCVQTRRPVRRKSRFIAAGCWFLVFCTGSFARDGFAQDGGPGAPAMEGAFPPFVPPEAAPPLVQSPPLAAANRGEAESMKPPVTHALPDQIRAMPSVSENLDVVQHHSQLIVARGKVVRTAVADPTIIDVVQFSPSELSVIGLELGSTTLTVWFDSSPQPLIYLVNTLRDPSVDERRRTDFGKLERKLAVLFPNSKVYLIPFSGKIVVKGQAHDSEEATKILEIVRGEIGGANGSPANPPGGIANHLGSASSGDAESATIVNLLEVPGEFQVMLRVQIAQLDRAQLRSRGVELTHLLFEGRHAAGCCAAAGTCAGIFEQRQICALINALAANGTAKMLSEPVLTVMSGHPASFLSGGEFAVPTIVGVEGVGAQQTTFRGFGTSLVVTPIVLDRDLIRMTIAPEFSQLNACNTVHGIPGVDTRRAQTTVQLREGQTIALAGLISHRMATETSRVRILSDLPVLGPRFFAGKRSRTDETELLILVTPQIVRPMDADEVPPLPGHDVTSPNDCEFYRYGRTEGCPDQGVYQAAPYGAGAHGGVQIGYRLISGAPAAVPSIASTGPNEGQPVVLPNGGYGPTPANAAAVASQQSASRYAPPSSRYQIPSAPVARADQPAAAPGGTVSSGAIRQAGATTIDDADAAQPAKPAPRWYQRPFQGIGRPQKVAPKTSDSPTTNTADFSTGRPDSSTKDQQTNP